MLKEIHELRKTAIAAHEAGDENGKADAIGEMQFQLTVAFGAPVDAPPHVARMLDLLEQASVSEDTEPLCALSDYDNPGGFRFRAWYDAIGAMSLHQILKGALNDNLLDAGQFRSIVAAAIRHEEERSETIASGIEWVGN